MGREQKGMDLILWLGVAGYCMRRHEARVWLHLTKVSYTIKSHLYFRLHSV